MIDFTKHKDRLRDYLKTKGVGVKHGVCHCFNPAHEDKNPSCAVSINCFYCPSCGAFGDIYDAVRLLENINDRKKQFDLLENLFAKKQESTNESGCKNHY
jgi:hypothetical protein